MNVFIFAVHAFPDKVHKNEQLKCALVFAETEGEALLSLYKQIPSIDKNNVVCLDITIPVKAYGAIYGDPLLFSESKEEDQRA